MNVSLNRPLPAKAMSEKRRIGLAFYMDSPLQREAWKILSAIPVGKRTDAVCHAVCRVHEQDSLLAAVRSVIREELGGAGFVRENTEQPQEAGYVGDDVLDFLLSLQGDE